MTMHDDGGGRDERFKSLYQRYYRRVIRFYVAAFRLAEEDAEELAQDAFVRFYEALDEYRGEAEWAFLETIARNVAYNRIRARQTAKRNAPTVNIDDTSHFSEPEAVPGPDYVERETAALRRKQLYEAIASLTPGQQRCLELWLGEQTYDEIAAALRITVDAVKSRLRDAKKILRARLGDANALPEDDQ
jgi:RNA polymerase sigma-70 factor (ECF subfamily)